MASLILPLIVSLIPSSPIVEEYLIVLRTEKVAHLNTFQMAVNFAKIEWEAELLLSLEEFRDMKGLEEDLRREILIQRNDEVGKFGMGANLVGASPRTQNIHHLFLSDSLDIRKALLAIRMDGGFYIAGKPTMTTERALFRYQFLSTIKRGLKEKLEAAIIEQEASHTRIEGNAYRREYGYI